MRWKCRREEKQKQLSLSPWKAQRRASHIPTASATGYILKPKTGSESVKDVPGLNCKECPRPYTIDK